MSFCPDCKKPTRDNTPLTQFLQLAFFLVATAWVITGGNMIHGGLGWLIGGLGWGILLHLPAAYCECKAGKP